MSIIESNHVGMFTYMYVNVTTMLGIRRPPVTKCVQGELSTLHVAGIAVTAAVIAATFRQQPSCTNSTCSDFLILARIKQVRCPTMLCNVAPMVGLRFLLGNRHSKQPLQSVLVLSPHMRPVPNERACSDFLILARIKQVRCPKQARLTQAVPFNMSCLPRALNVHTAGAFAPMLRHHAHLSLP